MAMAALSVVALLQRDIAIENEQRAVAAQTQAEKNFRTAERAINSLIFDIAQDLKQIEGVSPAAIQRILGQSRDALGTLLATDPENPNLRRMKAVALTQFGDVYLRSGQADQAAAAYEEAAVIFRALAKAEPENTGYRRDVSLSLNKLGDLRLRRGEADAALKAYEEGLAIRRALAKAEPENTGYRRDVSVSLDRLGDLRLAAAGRPTPPSKPMKRFWSSHARWPRRSPKTRATGAMSA